MASLVILESPNKVKKVSSFLGKGYVVKASFGHFKDLPAKELGVDLNTYKPKFVLKDAKARNIIKELKKLANGNTVYLATDPDREGYAIAYHLWTELKKVAKNIRRVEFREITEKHVKQQITKAVDFTRTNFGLFDAYLGRRVGDRLVGYLMSPLACKSLGGRFSVGRVQSPALRLVVEREREIRNFKPEPYYVVSVVCEKDGNKFKALYEGPTLKDKNKAQELYDKVKNANLAIVTKVDKKITRQTPPAPFTTSTLQQACVSRFKIAPEYTMKIAQDLFERGLITYHRTDSVRLSDEFIAKARQFIQNKFGNKYLPSKPRQYKSKNSQADAHEAIRPTHPKDLNTLIVEIKKEGLSNAHIKVFTLIYERALACQMSEAVFERTTAHLDVNKVPFKATGKVLQFDGFLALYKGGEEKEQKKDSENEASQSLPPLNQNEKVKKIGANCEEKFTKPPARYTEGTLVKELEKRGIGRPSTYASITYILKGAPIKGKPTRTPYVKVEKGKLVPTKEGEMLIDYLSQNHPWVVDYNMTKNMEDYLDKVERKQADWKKFVRIIHSRLNFVKEEELKNMRVVSEKAKKWALDIARQKGEDISDILDDPEKISKYIENNRDKSPSEKQIQFAQSLAEKTGVQLPENVLKDRELLSKWIDKTKKNMPITFSEKQKALLEKLGKGDLVDNPKEAKKFLDDYFKSFKKRSKSGSKSKGSKKKKTFKKSFRKNYVLRRGK